MEEQLSKKERDGMESVLETGKRRPAASCVFSPGWLYSCPMFSIFWKIAFGICGLLLIISVATLWLLAVYVTNLNHELRIAKDEILISQGKLIEAIHGHRQLTMENRAITSELKGLLIGWVAEEKRRTLQEGKGK